MRIWGHLGPRIYGNTDISGPYFGEPHLDIQQASRGKRRASHIILYAAHGSEESTLSRHWLAKVEIYGSGFWEVKMPWILPLRNSWITITK